MTHRFCGVELFVKCLSVGPVLAGCIITRLRLVHSTKVKVKVRPRREKNEIMTHRWPSAALLDISTCVQIAIYYGQLKGAVTVTYSIE